MLRRLLALPLLLVPFTALAPAQESDELEGLIREEVAAADSRTVGQLWGRAVELRDAGILGEEGELDRILDTELRRGSELSPAGLLLVAAARLQGDEPQAAPIARALEPLIDHPDEDLGRAAAELLGDPLFRGLTTSKRGALTRSLLKAAKDSGRSPEYRLSFAKSAYILGGGRERREANKVMKSFLSSDDPELRSQGALALAELDHVPIEGELRRVLERLERTPDTRGALARAYLDREKTREVVERRYRDLRKASKTENLPEELRQFWHVLNMIQAMHLEGGTVDREKLMKAAMNGMLRWMDPHSNYLAPADYAKFFQELEAEYGGIGAYVNEDPDDSLFTVVRPIYSGPAYQVGIQTDDKIVRINDWPTLDQPVDDIIKNLKGKPGTTVDLYVWKRGMDPSLIERPTEDMKVTVVRERVTIPPGSYQMLPGGIGLIQLTTFSKRSMDEIRRWIPKLLDNGMKALIFDLRYNTGGLLTEAREVADLFLPAGKAVVSTVGRGRKAERETLKTIEPAMIPEDMPLVVLTGRQTASAAEIVSGALQDHERATLVGQLTYGKGSVQQLIPVLREELEDKWDETNGDYIWNSWEPILDDKDGDGEVDYAPRVKLTIAKYLLPSGRSIHRQLDRDGHILTAGGVQPEIEIEQPLIERWRLEEQRRVLRSAELRGYVDSTYPTHRELFGQLAVNDQKNPELYPRFDALMAELGTNLARDDVRRMLRAEIRRRVQDDRGQEFPAADFVEDVQVQKAIEVALAGLDKEVVDVSEYGLVFELPPEDSGPGEIASLNSIGDPELARARDLIEKARTGAVLLTEQDLDEILSILGDLEKKN